MQLPCRNLSKNAPTTTGGWLFSTRNVSYSLVLYSGRVYHVLMRGYKALTSSLSVEWSTPQWLFDRLDREFRFTLDPCSSGGVSGGAVSNSKCTRTYTAAENGLKQRWSGRVFMNPPYGAEIGAWVEKAYRESTRSAEVVVCLLPARTDTEWWHRWCVRGEIRFIRGRLKFGKSLNSATFPSVVVVFRGESDGRYEVVRRRE